MSAGLLGDYESDEEEADPLKDGYEARQAIAQQFLDASSLLDDLDEEPAAEAPAPPGEEPVAAPPSAPIEPMAVDAGGPPEPPAAPLTTGPEESAAELWAGCIVRAFGLQKAQALNGRMGIVRDGPTGGRWQVEFWNDSGSAVDVNASIKRENLELLETPPEEEQDVMDKGDEEEQEAELTPGTEIQVQGLKAAASLNGLLGRLLSFNEESGRWQVLLHNGGSKAIKPENLRAVQAEPDSNIPLAEFDEFEEFDGTVEPEPPAPKALVSDVPGPYAKLDSNELQAAILQAELCCDDEALRGLQDELELRQAKGTDGGRETVTAPQWVHESVDVPMEAVGAVIGTGGANIKAMASESGARMGFQRDEEPENTDPGFLSLTLSRKCLISGPAEAVAKAKELLQQTIAEYSQNQGRRGKGKGKGQRKGTPMNLASDLISQGAGGRAGFQCGICKWYAAGFCRNRADENGACRNGLHSSEAALKAEADWTGAGPAVAVEAKRPILLVLDLEGGGNQDGRDGEDEIIEVPVLSMCPATGTELGRFHRFARPGFWVREAGSMRKRFHPNCFNEGANSVPFPEVIDAMHQWLRDLLKLAPEEELRQESFLFVTCGNWDVKTAIPRQCNKPFPGAVDFTLQQLLFSRWTNIKEVFRDHFKLSDADAPTGMRGMLKRLRMPLAGQHHLGMDDVSNIAKILQRLIRDGCSIKPTGHASLKVSGPMKGGKGGFGKGKDKGKGKGKDKGKDKKGGKACFAEIPPPPQQGAMAKSASFSMKGQKGKNGETGKGDGHVVPPKAASGTGHVVLPRGSAPWQWGTGLVPTSGAAPTEDADGESADTPSKELQAFLHSAPLPGESWGDEDEDEAPGKAAEDAPMAKPNKELEAFLNGEPMPGASWDEDEAEVPEQAPAPEPEEAEAKPKARPGEDWMDMDQPETFRFPAPKRTSSKLEGPVASLSEILGEADDEEAEGEGVLLEPVSKAPRIASLLATLPAPKAHGADPL